MKQTLIHYLIAAVQVAPPAGAWIETIKSWQPVAVSRNVAPPAGAWIETMLYVCGAVGTVVAPPAGAWIETCE